MNDKDKIDLFCFYGFSSSDYKKEKSSVQSLSKGVFDWQNNFCLYPFVFIFCPSLDCCWIKDYATLGVKSFQKFKGLSVLLDDYPFLKELL